MPLDLVKLDPSLIADIATSAMHGLSPAVSNGSAGPTGIVAEARECRHGYPSAMGFHTSVLHLLPAILKRLPRLTPTPTADRARLLS